MLVEKLEKLKVRLDNSFVHETTKDIVSELVDALIEHEKRDEFEFAELESENKETEDELKKHELKEEKEEKESE